MTQLILLISILFPPLLAISQELKVRNPNRDMRAGFESAVEFSLNKKFDSVDLRVSQGKVYRDGKIIYLTPATSGKDSLFAKFFYRRKFVHSDTLIFDIIKPEVFPSFSADLLKDRKFSLADLKAKGGIIFYIRVNDYHWESAGVESYRFSIIRKDSCIFSKIEYSYRFSDELKSSFDLLKPGDMILISDATINPLYARYANILPGVFEIE